MVVVKDVLNQIVNQVLEEFLINVKLMVEEIDVRIVLIGLIVVVVQ